MTVPLTPASVGKVNGIAGCYLLHFTPRYRHAGHYLGYADDIGRRVQQHEFGMCDVRLILAAVRAGVKFTLVRTWTGTAATRKLERKLKGGKNRKRTGSLARLCPLCMAAKRMRATSPSDGEE